MTAYEELTHNASNQVTDGIWRVTDGPYGDAVLKICTPNGAGAWESSDDPAHWNYWRREVFAYETSLTSTAFGMSGITGPELLDLESRDDGAVGLWLEDVTGEPGFDWTVDALAEFARKLGTAQAHWATVGLPDLRWLSRGWLRQYANRNVQAADIPWDHPAAAAAWPVELRRQLQHIWENRNDVITATENAPQTLCHLDVWPMNLIRESTVGGRMILLDWSFVGHGALGEDVANLIIDCVSDGHMPIDQLPEIDLAVTDGYLAGLRDGGWTENHDQIRRTITTAGVAKYCWLAPMMLQRLAADRPVGSAAYEADAYPAVILERRRLLFEYLVRWARS